MATYVNFFKGAHADLPKSNYQPGAFYLTTDTSRLYFADSTSKLLDLNKYILFVQNIAALPQSAREGDIYYCTEENVLATYANGRWQQINRNTDTDTQPIEISQSVAADANGISVTLTLKTRIWNEQTQNWVTDSDQSYPITFTIDKKDIYDVIPESQVDVTASATNTAITVTTKGDGSSGDGFVLNAGNGVAFDGSTDNITINATTYSLSSEVNSTDIKVNDQAGNLAGKVTYEAGSDLDVTGVEENKIKYSHATINTTESSSTTQGFGTEIKYVKGLEYNNGHLTKCEKGTFTMPAEPNYSVTAVDKGAEAGTLQVGIRDAEGSNNGGTLTSDKILYYTVGAQGTETVYNTQALPVYTIAEVNKKFNQLDSMHYMGTVNGSTTNLPTTNVRNGDTYKNIGEGATYLINSAIGDFILIDGTRANTIDVEMGDLFIATGTEDATTGYITGKISWSYVPSGNDLDSQYELTTSGNKVTLINTSVEDDKPGSIEFAAGTDLSVTTNTTGKNGKITYTHSSHNGTKKDAESSTSYSGTFSAITGVTVSNGHIDDYTVTTFDMPQAEESRLTAINDTDNKTPLLKVTDNLGTTSTVRLEEDGQIEVRKGTSNNGNTITFKHKAHAGTHTEKKDSNALLAGFGGSFTAINAVKLDNGHIDEYTTQQYTLPADPSMSNATIGVSASNNVVTVAETFYQPNSTLSDEISISHGFMTNTASVELTANSGNVGIDLVWKSFAG